MTDELQDRLMKASYSEAPEIEALLLEAATSLREQQTRIAQDSQWLISYQRLLENTGCPPSSTDIIEAWKAVKIAKIERLKEDYAGCIEDMADWGSYASEYFQKKHDLEGDIKRHKENLE